MIAPAETTTLWLVCVDAPEDALARELGAAYSVVRWDGNRRPPPGPAPAVIFYAAAPTAALSRRVRRWARWRCPDALVGGPWNEAIPVGSLDFFLVPDAEAAGRLERAGVHRRRIRREGAQGVAGFLRARREAQRRSLLWVEEDVSLRSPSTKHLVTSVPHLLERGWEITVWSYSADALDERVEVDPLPALPRRLGPLAPYWFWLAANLRGLIRRVRTGRRAATVVHTIGGAYLGADLASIQFVNQVWLYRQLELGLSGLKAVLVFLWTIPAAGKDWLQFKNPRCRTFLPASDSIAAEVRSRAHSGAQIVVLPNSYDETRFNPSVRQRWRAEMREKLGFTSAETVFCFASQGHYQRKGFWLAVEALSRLQNPAAKLLVIGGQARTLDGVKERLSASCPGWEGWVTFVGMQPAVETYFAAADAFLFPSYFEAFCLAEIEAGAMGLPLLLTSHHGTEMILRDGINGVELSFEPAKMAAAVQAFLERGLPPFDASPGRGLDRLAYARALANVYEHGQPSRP